MVKICFLGGADIKKESSKPIHKRAFKEAGRAPSLLVFPWTKRIEKRKYRKIMNDYFEDCGARTVKFGELTDSLRELQRKGRLRSKIKKGECPMSLEEIKALVRKGIEALNKGDLTVLDEFMAPDYVDHTNQLRGREMVKRLYMRTFKDIPDFHRAIKDIVAEGDKVWVLFKITGTDTTGKKIELASVNIFRIVNGKVVEGWTVPQFISSDKKLKVT